MSLFATSMFDARKTLWDNMGEMVTGAASSHDAIKLAGLDWNVVPKKVYSEDGLLIPGQFVNIKESDNTPLGIVGERYQIVQNRDAFEFTDSLLGEGVKYETAGAFDNGKTIWLLARMPEDYKILGEDISPYVVFTNNHSGSGSIKVAVTSVRVYCKNTLNLSLKRAKRTWSARHTGNINTKMSQARQTLQLTNKYMEELNTTFESLYQVKLNKDKMVTLVKDLVKIDDDMSNRQKTNLERIQNDIIFRYEMAPDLKDREQTGARFIQAVLDSSEHIEPARLTQNYQANLFSNMINKNELADRAMELVFAAA